MSDGVRWQWAALQMLFYGSECYAHLLRWLPEWFEERRRTRAAIVVQEQYRNRVGRRFARGIRQVLAS